MPPASSENASSTPSKPIPIDNRGRRRRGSESSESDSSPDSLVRSPTESPSPPRIAVRTSPLVSPSRISPSTSPILSYFFPNTQQPKQPLTVGRIAPGSIPSAFDDDDGQDPVLPASAHARRLSNTWAAGNKLPSPTSAVDDRSAGLMRRLSLGGAFHRPAMPFGGGTDQAPLPPRVEAPTIMAPVPPGARRAKRSHTLAVPPSPPKARAPSPMGERILKGHFDGFN